jgi:8-oxo-dGTP pyrophosphatase MutT (NUDIX family)
MADPTASTEPGAEPPKDRIRDAASVVVLRRDGGGARVLMGQRGKAAAFMPSKFVFPGGAVDADDHAVAALCPPPSRLVARLGHGAAEGLGAALAIAAVRELWEETGLALARPARDAAALPVSWARFAAGGRIPAAEGFEMIFRAITPPGRPRRFDARFVMVEAEALAGDLDDFSAADEELAHLHWISPAEARALDLPFVTELVLAEIEARLALGPDARTRPAPFFHHDGGRSFIDPL